MPQPDRHHIIKALWPDGLPSRVGVWAILDAARDQRIFSAVDRTYQDKCCLYAGDLPWQLQMAAPYLVHLEPEDRFTNYLIDNGWGNSWGVFLRTETSLKNLRNHLRGFLRVRDEAGRRLIFRYYDPRVLRVYLPTCVRSELHTVFGPILQFLTEARDPAWITEFSFDGSKLEQTQISTETGRRITTAPEAPQKASY
jgi:hypothetical protein